MRLALFEKHREMPVTPLKGLLPLVLPRASWSPHLSHKNCRPLSAPPFSHNKHCRPPPASLYKCRSTAVSYLSTCVRVLCWVGTLVSPRSLTQKYASRAPYTVANTSILTGHQSTCVYIHKYLYWLWSVKFTCYATAKSKHLQRRRVNCEEMQWHNLWVLEASPI